MMQGADHDDSLMIAAHRGAMGALSSGDGRWRGARPWSVPSLVV